MTPFLLELINISKKNTTGSDGSYSVLCDINMQIEAVESTGFVTSLIAPSEVGRTTLLRIISGIENQSGGYRKLNGNEYHQPNGSIAYIPENPCSYPWLSVKQNVLFALKCKRLQSDENEIMRVLKAVELTGYEDHFPDAKSIGFRFRIALARALSVNPKIIVLNDPFSKMSIETKLELYSVIKNICNIYRVVFLLATSNLIESIMLSKILFLMSGDSGTIFDKIKSELGNSTILSPFKDEAFLELLNRVELKLREQNFSDTLKYSV